jgi:hypothetical protein
LAEITIKNEKTKEGALFFNNFFESLSHFSTIKESQRIIKRVLDIIKGNAVQQLTFMNNINRYLGNTDFSTLTPNLLSNLLGSCFAIVSEIFKGHAAILSQTEIAESFLDVR